MMCKNAHYDKYRRKKSEISTTALSLDDEFTSNAAHEETGMDRTMRDQRYLPKLHRAIGQLGEACRAIVEENVLGGLKLIELRKKLEYGGGYQAIVQKKKRCLKKLTKLFFEELKKK